MDQTLYLELQYLVYFVIFQADEFFRIKIIPDTREARQLISELGLVLNDTVEMVKTQARS